MDLFLRPNSDGSAPSAHLRELGESDLRGRGPANGQSRGDRGNRRSAKVLGRKHWSLKKVFGNQKKE